jgi:hypothetical protein
LGLFDWENPNQKKSFAVTIIMVAGGTYFFSGCLIWVVRKSERREMFKKPWMYVRNGVGKLLHWVYWRRYDGEGETESGHSSTFYD